MHTYANGKAMVRFGGTPKRIHCTYGTWALCSPADVPTAKRTIVTSSRASAWVEDGETPELVARRLAAELASRGLEPVLCPRCRDVWDAPAS